MLLLDEPTNHLDAESVAWLERYLHDFPGTVVAVTHDRYFLDNVAGWILELDRGYGIPYEGNYTSWLEQKQARLATRGEDRVGAAAHAGARARVGAHRAARAPGEEQGARAEVRGAGRRGDGREDHAARDRHSAAAATRQRRRRRRRTSQKAFGDKLLFDGLHVRAAARRHRRHHRPERRRQDDAVPDDRRSGKAGRRARSRSARRCRSRTSIRAARSIANTRRGRRSPAARR